MKKLKTWQIVLLVIFYPVGLVYLIVWLCKRSKLQNAEVIKEFDCGVMATTYPNEDGTSRQTYIVNLKPGEDLFFKPAPTEEYPDSIGVFNKKGGQIGVVPYNVLNELRGLYSHNSASVVVKDIVHSERGLGCNMLIKVYK